MFTINEIHEVLQKGILAMKKANHNNSLRLEVQALQEEIKSLDTSRGFMNEASVLSCEYYANEINNTLSAI